jgi:hypothetical protein
MQGKEEQEKLKLTRVMTTYAKFILFPEKKLKSGNIHFYE